MGLEYIIMLCVRILTMLQMVVMSWIVCVLVLSSAIPLVKKSDVKQTDDNSAVFAGENSEAEVEESRDGKSIMESRAAVNKTDHHPQAVPKAEVLALINRMDYAPGKIHVELRKIYHRVTKINRSTQDMYAMSDVRDNLAQSFPSLHVSDKTFKAGNVVSTHSDSPEIDITKHTDKGYLKSLNSPAAQANSHMKEKQQISQEDKKEELKISNESEMSTTRPVSIFNDDVARPTLVEPDVNEAPVTSCQHVPGFYEPRFLLMVVSCSNHWTDLDIKSKCESWENLDTENFMNKMMLLPVQDKNGTVFANVYCAMCHGVTVFLPWTTSFVCNTASPESFQITDFTNLTPFYLHLIGSKCERRIIPFISKAVKECKKALHAAMDSARKNTIDEQVSISSTYPISFSVLMNFDFTGKTHILFSASQTIVQREYMSRCQDGMIYDPYIDTCRQLSCNGSSNLVGKKCVGNGVDSTSTDGITNLSQLRTVDIVTLQVNITFKDFLMMKFKDTEPDIIPQIAELLNISVDRFKDVNITYELGSINGSALEVTTLTEDEYKNILPYNFSRNVTHTATPDWMEAWRTDGTAEERTSELPEVTSADSDSSHDKMAQSATYDNLNGGLTTQDETILKKGKSISTKFKLQLTTPYTNFITSKRKEAKLKLADDPTHLSQPPRAQRTIITKKKHKSKDNSAIMNDWRTNFNLHNLTLSKKLLNYHGFLENTRYDEFFRFHFKTSDDEADLYISVPVNDQNDRIFIITRDSQSFQQLLQQSMVMRISFVLVSPDDPLSNEAGSMTLLQKIDNLIFEQRFSLNLNGNTVDVVAIDDDRNKTKDSVEFCSWGVEYIVYDEEFMMVTVGNETLLYVNKTNSYISAGLFDLFIIVSGSNTAEQTNVTDLMRYAFVCFMPRITEDCRRIVLEKKEYYFAGHNKSIIFEDKEYDIFKYRVLDESTGSVQICVPSTFPNDDETVIPHIVTLDNGCSHDFDATLRAEGYMTLILGRVSTVALCCVILTYIILPALRNLPGLNLMSLTVCLLVTQVIFAEGIGEDRSWLCKTVAVSLHYTLLAAHFWMNVISYDVYKTFTSPITTTHVRDKAKYFPRYSIYAWGTPFIIVSICAFVDFSNLFDGVYIGYGSATVSSTADLSCHNCTVNAQDHVDSSNTTWITEDKTIHSCWITEPLAALVAFGAIILLIFLVNCILFVKTIMSISKTTKITRDSLSARYSNSSSRKIPDHSEVRLYVRMSTVMGFTWIFGLSSSILSSFAKPPTNTACAVIHLVAILFIILNTSQGFFIFVAFVCSRRVFGLYKECIRGVLKHKHIGRPFITSSSKSVLAAQKR